MTSVVEVLRAYPRVVAALREVVDAHSTDDPMADGAIARLEFAVTEAEVLLDEVTLKDVDAGDGSTAAASSTGAEGDAGSGPTAAGARSPKPASTKSSTATGGRRRQPSPGAAAGGDAAEAADTKICQTCKQEKPRTEFSKNRARKDGLAGSCKPCHRDTVRKSNAKRRQREQSGNDGDKEPSSVGADVITLHRPAPIPAVPAKDDERTCATCNKALPVTSFRLKPRGRSKNCVVCDGSQNVPANGPDPLPGEITFSITLTCSRCDLEKVSKHPLALDRDAIVDAWRRVEQALHDCPGELTAAVDTAGRDRPGETAPVPHRAATDHRELIAAVVS